MNAQVVGVSVDHVPALKAWADSLGGVTFPLLSDFWPHGEAAREWGVLNEEEGYTERAIFVVGSDGVVRYTDVHDIDDQPDNAEVLAVLEDLEPTLAARMHAEADVSAGKSAAAEAEAAEAAAEEVPSAAEREVLMFCTPWCPDCRMAREWLEKHDIPYREVDVTRDAAARDRAAAHNEGRLHTPTFEIGGEVCVDFRPDRLSELLGTGS